MSVSDPELAAGRCPTLQDRTRRRKGGHSAVGGTQGEAVLPSREASPVQAPASLSREGRPRTCTSATPPILPSGGTQSGLECAVGKAWPPSWPQRPVCCWGLQLGGLGLHRCNSDYDGLGRTEQWLCFFLGGEIQRALEMCVRWESHFERATRM